MNSKSTVFFSRAVIFGLMLSVLLFFVGIINAETRKYNGMLKMLSSPVEKQAKSGDEIELGKISFSSFSDGSTVAQLQAKYKVNTKIYSDPFNVVYITNLKIYDDATGELLNKFDEVFPQGGGHVSILNLKSFLDIPPNSTRTILLKGKVYGGSGNSFHWEVTPDVFLIGLPVSTNDVTVITPEDPGCVGKKDPITILDPSSPPNGNLKSGFSGELARFIICAGENDVVLSHIPKEVRAVFGDNDYSYYYDKNSVTAVNMFMMDEKNNALLGKKYRL